MFFYNDSVLMAQINNNDKIFSFSLFGTIDVDVLIPPMEQMKLSNIESADKSEAKNVKANRIKLL